MQEKPSVAVVVPVYKQQLSQEEQQFFPSSLQ